MAPSQINWEDQAWRNNEAVAYYGGINNSNVHLYFMNSPFFDPTSNNGAVNAQAQYNPTMFATVQDRAKFEAHLRGMTGVEYMVVDAPTDAKQFESPVWVFSQQERRKRPGVEDQITILSTYYVIGENVYQAPSVEKVLTSKLMSITNCLSDFLSVAATLPQFSPAKGHQYLTGAANRARKRVAIPKVPSRVGSRQPSVSSEAPPSLEAASNGTKGVQNINDTYDDLRLLSESLNLTFRYGSEFMDENPLLGEPGNFVFTSSAEHLRAQHQAEKAKADAPAAAQTSASPSKGSSGPGTPLPELKTQIVGQSRKGSKPEARSPLSAGVPKLKRKKTGKSTVSSPGNRSPT